MPDDPVTTDTQAADASAASTAAKSDAETALAALADAGITIDNAAQFTQAQQQLGTLLQLIDDPKAFLQELRTVKPTSYERLIDLASADFIEKYGDDEDRAVTKGELPPAGGKPTAGDSAVRVMLGELKEELTSLKQAYQSDVQQKRLDQVTQKFSQEVDAVLAKVPELKNYERKLMKAEIGRLVASDRAVLNRIQNGVFVDVPRFAKGVLDERTSELKTSVKTEAEQRAATAAAAAANPVTSSPGQVGGSHAEAGKDDGDWSSTTRDLAAAFRQATKP